MTATTTESRLTSLLPRGGRGCDRVGFILPICRFATNLQKSLVPPRNLFLLYRNKLFARSNNDGPQIRHNRCCFQPILTEWPLFEVSLAILWAMQVGRHEDDPA
ncbi:MAG: hypothetical protein EBU59_13190 [Planctomycetia bacterium]|nr:hypothetical protein [Planctomycetia bacterium]